VRERPYTLFLISKIENFMQMHGGQKRQDFTVARLRCETFVKIGLFLPVDTFSLYPLSSYDTGSILVPWIP
jgi:hypothetical protein